jgi:hypothetical protein
MQARQMKVKLSACIDVQEKYNILTYQALYALQDQVHKE